MALSRTIRADLAGRPMTVYPGELSVAWAYRLRWQPLPVMQAHMAYTSALAAADARRLVSPAAPERILVQAGTGAVGRWPGLDEPLATTAMLCHYAPGPRDRSWLVLRRLPRSRCGAPRPLGTTTAAWGEWIDIPRDRHPDSMVVARIRGAAVDGLERLRAMALRADERWIRMGSERSTFVPGTAADGIPVAIPASADLPRPFRRVPTGSSFRLERAGTGGRLQIEWVEVPAGP